MLGTKVGNYEVISQIGLGGMGVVYLAKHLVIGRPAAIKVLRAEMSIHQDMVSRFFNEARAATAIRHPGIVEIYDFGYLPDGKAYLVMELLEGDSLAERLARLDRLPIGYALAITRQIASALQAAHAQQIIHRDLKPENIIILSGEAQLGGDRIKLLDFGIAKLGASMEASQTRTGELIGTPTYMSPEQCRGAGKVDARSDLYSLGCVLYSLVCGRPPFDGEGAGELIAHHMYFPPDPPRKHEPSLPAEVDRLIRWLLEKDPKDRPSSAGELVEAIDRLGVAPITTLAVPLSPRRTRLAAQLAGVAPAPRRLSTPRPGLSEEMTAQAPLIDRIPQLATPLELATTPPVELDSSSAPMNLAATPAPASSSSLASASSSGASLSQQQLAQHSQPHMSLHQLSSPQLAPYSELPSEHHSELHAEHSQHQLSSPQGARYLTPPPRYSSTGKDMTTLRGSASQMREAVRGVELTQARRRARLMWSSVLGGIASLCVLIGALSIEEEPASSASAELSPDPRDVASLKPAVAPPVLPPAPPPVELVENAIDSTPPGAEVLLDGKPVGTTPFSERIARPDAARTYVLRLDGYGDGRAFFTGKANDRRVVTLVKKPTPQRPPVTSRPRREEREVREERDSREGKRDKPVQRNGKKDRNGLNPFE